MRCTGPPGRIAEHARLGCPVDVRTASGRVPEGRRTRPCRRRPRAACNCAHALSTWKRVYIGVVIAALFFNFHSSFFAVTQDAPVSFTDAVMALPWFLIGSLACSTFTAAWLDGRAQKGEYQTKYPRLSRARRSAANSVLLENRLDRRTGGRLVSTETAQRPGMDPERAAIVRRDGGCSRATRRSDGALALRTLRHDIQMDRRSAALLFVQSDD